MEFIDRQHIAPPLVWRLQTAAILTRASLLEDPKERQQLLQKGEKWQPVTANLSGISNNRCWYCETSFVRDRPHLDHFRPKSEAKNEDGEVFLEYGYWWLTLDFWNFRVACSYCNTLNAGDPDGITKGKGSFFPLLTDFIALGPTDHITSEAPALLDPCIEADVELISFNDLGEVELVPGQDPTSQTRVCLSIRLLNLNHPRLSDQRKRIHLEIENYIRHYECWIETASNAELPSTLRRKASETCANAIEELRRLVAPGSEYRGVALRFIRRRRSTHRWLERYLHLAFREEEMRPAQDDGTTILRHGTTICLTHSASPLPPPERLRIRANSNGESLRTALFTLGFLVENGGAYQLKEDILCTELEVEKLLEGV